MSCFRLLSRGENLLARQKSNNKKLHAGKYSGDDKEEKANPLLITKNNKTSLSAGTEVESALPWIYLFPTFLLPSRGCESHCLTSVGATVESLCKPPLGSLRQLARLS